MKWHVNSRVHVLPSIGSELTDFISINPAIITLPKVLFI